MSEAFKDFLNYFGSDPDRYVWELGDGSIAADLDGGRSPMTEAETLDLRSRSQRFFDSLDNLLAGETVAIHTTLLEKLSRYLPHQECLNILKICQEKCYLVRDYREQLSLAIADLLPQWHDEDRTILMRSYAGAFRSGSEANNPLENAEQDWEAMSSVEQAQYLVAIADFVLTELRHEQKD